MNLNFESVLARSPNPYVILDASLVIQWANAAYLSATESRWDEIKPVSYTHLTLPTKA